MKKDYLIGFVVFLISIPVVLVMVFGMRWLNEKITPLKVQEVDVGVKCATLHTSDGVAIDCWKD